jgi:hypothetical protein
MTRQSICLALIVLSWLVGKTGAQTADDVTKLINRLVDLDSIDLCQFGVKYRDGLEPSLAAVDADESAMRVLKNPYEAQGQGKPGAVGWYRVSFDFPERLGRFELYDCPCGVESNVRGSWEIYTYRNGKPAGLGGGPFARLGFHRQSNKDANAWVSNSPMDPPKKGDKITIAILASSYPLGAGNPEGFALRHLRMRVAGGHSPNRSPFFSELLAIRDRLQTLKGDELKALQSKVRDPLARLDVVFQAAEIGDKKGRNLFGPMSNAMRAATKELIEAQKK